MLTKFVNGHKIQMKQVWNDDVLNEDKSFNICIFALKNA